MQEYEDIVKREDKAVSILSSSSLVHFFISTMVLLVAIGGARAQLLAIARPMAEIVRGTNFIGLFKTADIAALVIIMVEISMGLFLMESLRITRLFPVIGALPDKLRSADDLDHLQHPAAVGEHRGGPRLHARGAATG